MIKPITTLVGLLLVAFGTVSSINGLGVQGDDQVISVWDANSGGLVSVVESEDYINNAALSADGRRVIATFDSGWVRVYDADTGTTIAERFFPDNTGRIYLVDVALGNRVLVSINRDLWLWDLSTNDIMLYIDLPNTLYAVPLPGSPDATYLPIYVHDSADLERGWLNVYNLNTGEKVWSVPTKQVWEVNWNPAGDLLVANLLKGFVIYDGATGEMRLEYIDGHIGWLNDRNMVWSSDGQMFITMVSSPSPYYTHNSVVIFDGSDLTARYTLQFDSPLANVAISPDNRLLLTAVRDIQLVGSRFVPANSLPEDNFLYDLASGEHLDTFGGTAAQSFIVTAAGWSSVETQVITSGYVQDDDKRRSQYILWDPETGEMIHQEQVASDERIDLYWSSDRTGVMTFQYGASEIDLIRFRTAYPLIMTLTHENTLLGAVWSADNTRIVTWTGQNRG
jgi:WD40 repeat protein